MEETGFKIEANWVRKKVVFFACLVFAIGVFTVLYFGMKTEFSGKALAYAKEASISSGELLIPSISLSSPVSNTELKGRTLDVPNYIVGKYAIHKNKELLMGHSSTVFQNLSEIEDGDEIIYNGQRFEVVSKEVRPKEEIIMREILEEEKEPTVVLMTCSGEHISGQDYSHRLIVYAMMSSK